ncbi:MAG TPA: RNA methyltransferase [Sediminibacterium sp.]|nr:RNA methyltransferase [Sediminibacterium sp.]
MRKRAMEELGRLSVTQFRAAHKHPIVVVLDNIRSMHNVGSVFRTADAFLIAGVYLCGYTPRPPHRDIQKTALGATETVQWTYFPDTLSALLALKQEGYLIYAVEQTDQSVLLPDFQVPEHPFALVFGNEVAGVADPVLGVCDGSIEIPQFGMKHSLNISVAAGIVLWEMVRASAN